MARGTKTEKTMLFKDALIIGLCQCVATLPGLSRSGTTITAGIATGHERSYAVKFSLLMSIPAVLGATLLAALAVRLYFAVRVRGYSVDINDFMIWGENFLNDGSQFYVGVLSIGLLRMIAKKTRFGGFAYYCWVVGVLTIILSLIF